MRRADQAGEGGNTAAPPADAAYAARSISAAIFDRWYAPSPK